MDTGFIPEVDLAEKTVGEATDKALKNIKKLISEKYGEVNVTETISGEGIILTDNKAKGILIKGIKETDKLQWK